MRKHPTPRQRKCRQPSPRVANRIKVAAAVLGAGGTLKSAADALGISASALHDDRRRHSALWRTSVARAKQAAVSKALEDREWMKAIAVKLAPTAADSFDPSKGLMAFFQQVYCSVRMLTPATCETYASALHKFRMFCLLAGKADTFDNVTPETMGQYFVWLTGGGSKLVTALAHRRSICAVLSLAKRRKLTTVDIDEIPRPKATRLQPRAWHLAEFERVLWAADGLTGQIGPWKRSEWFTALLLVCWSTGWRISTVMRLRCDHVSMRSGFVSSIETKTSEERTAKLSPQAIRAVQKIWGEREHLFGDWPFDRGARQWKQLNAVLGDCIKRAEVPDYGRFHTIRKTVCTAIAVAAGDDAAAEAMGHTSTAVTRRHYIDRTKITRATAADRLPTLNVTKGGAA